MILKTSTRSTLALLALAGVLIACDSTPIAPDKLPVVESRPAGNTGSSTAGGAGATAGGTPQSQVASVDLTRSATAGGAALLAAPSQRVVYFDFDSFAIRDEFKPLIEGHARVLSAARDKKLVIEGHTDERGGREYNLALGQKRAEAVLRSMTLLGATDGQLEAVSYGKERPAAAGSDEAAWAKNRRAELKDR
ncbi:MAG: peptidoglycan-associated lipoprotein Pal [Burkholderiales bacterium]|nr:peptidoglycan-associated lipoprotein Pal [Burkholderiales bacterium]